MKVAQLIEAPQGSAFSRFAFQQLLGTSMTLSVNGDPVGDATLVGAITGERNRSIVLVYDVDKLAAGLFSEWLTSHRKPVFDLPPYEQELNPYRAMRLLDAAIAEETGDPLEWSPLRVRLHEAFCATEHPHNDPQYFCVQAQHLCLDWLADAGLDAGSAIGRDARFEYANDQEGANGHSPARS